MAPFIFNDRLQSTLEKFTGSTQYFLGDQGPFSYQLQLQIIQQIMRSSANLTVSYSPELTTQKSQEGSNPGSLRAIFANECWNVGLNPTLSHFVMEQNLVEKSKVHHKVLICPGKQCSFQNVRNVMLAVQFHS